MANHHESPKDVSKTATDAQSKGMTDERSGMRGGERLATLLMRLVGVYFTAGAVIYGSEAAIHMLYAVRRFGLQEAITLGYWDMSRLGSSFVQLIIGVYLVVGGQWVLEKLLTPVGRSFDAIADGDEEPSSDVPGGK
jgi:hypothetical protein